MYVEPLCQLPGIKQERGKSTEECMQQILVEKLSPLDGLTEVLGTERDSQIKASKAYDVKSKYLRTIYSLSLNSDLQCPRCRISSQSRCLECSDKFVDRDVYLISNATKDREELFAWMSTDEFDHLSSPTGEQA